ncbi:MAG: Rpn family recombination-promoting nuclease/putative transposase [Prevotellaceae bacterium]|jgi:hypothetical protein|nr:Rpn family recombination-promoting nuclease/putative transposase [Prevotellaceae bacterium]
MSRTKKKNKRHVFINPRTDFGFKKIFGNKRLLIAFLNSILSEHIVEVTYLPQEQLGYRAKDRKAVYDIYCIDDTGKRFIIEMQNARQPNFIDRTLFYASYPILHQAPKGKVKITTESGEEKEIPWDYELTNVYFVCILNFVLFEEESARDIVVESITLVRQTAGIACTDKFKVVTVELPKFKKSKKELRTLLDKWIYTLQNIDNLQERPHELDEEIFKELFEDAKLDKLTQEEMETYNKSILEYDDVILALNYTEKRGIQIGEERVRKEHILNAYRNNISIEDIAKFTGLSVEQIRNIILTN